MGTLKQQTVYQAYLDYSNQTSFTSKSGQVSRNVDPLLRHIIKRTELDKIC
jgi:hypothetical protein